jgi:hypothetical protein
VDLDTDAGLAVLVDNLEGEVLDIVLDGLVGELLANETFLPESQYLGTGVLRERVLTMSKTVRWGLLAYWFFAASPTRRSSSVKATQDGVMRLPEEDTC